MKRLLCPSMMCANYGHLAAELRRPQELAETACAHLVALMRGETAPARTVIPVSLIRRDSTR